MSDFHGGEHLLDQDEVWIDDDRHQWPVYRIPAATARELLDDLRTGAYQALIRYTLHMRRRADVARRFGEDVPLDWAPDSATFYDRCFESELVGGPATDRLALALQWLDAKPLIRALEERARS